MVRRSPRSFFRLFLLVTALMAAVWFAFRPVAQPQDWVQVRTQFALCGEGSRQEGCVVDGDTVIIGSGPARRRIRLTGFDAPELEGACEAESVIARQAKAKLHQWITQGPFEWSGGGDPPRDQYGRELRAARRIAKDGTAPETLADIMIASGLASGSGWGDYPSNWCAP